jgi:hypothetical protein
MSRDYTGLVAALQLTDEQLKEWCEKAKERDMSLELFIIDSVEGGITRSEIIKYLDNQPKKKPWKEKRIYSL